MKRGQITVFIIIGIIMLIIVGFFIYVGTSDRAEEYRAQVPDIAKVPQESRPVFDHVQSCIELLGKEAVRLVGARGGYIGRQFSYNPIAPTSADAVQFSAGGDLIVPYWYHMSSPDSCTSNCQFEENIPALFAYESDESIESQLGAYVSSNLRDCVDFSGFEEQGMSITELTRPAIKATIAPENVFFSGTYDLRVEREGAVTEINEYYVPLDVDLQQAYELAVQVTSLESRQSFLETFTREVISLFSGMADGQLPPTSAFRMSFDAPKHWLQYEAQDDAERLITSHISLLRATAADNFEYTLAPDDVKDPLLYESIYDRQFMIPLNGSYDYSLKFAYLPWWNSYFDLNCDGELCTAESADMPLHFMIGLRQYLFQYDMSYPVLVVLEDADAFNGEGFAFQFFLEANMRNNVPLKGLDILPEVGFREPSIFCNPDQFDSGEFKLTVLDKVTKEPIDASVMFRCGPETCVIGETEQGELDTRLPTCVNGVLLVTSQDYMQQAEMITTTTSDERSMLFELLPAKEVEVSAQKFLLMKYGKSGEWRLESVSLPENVDADETVIVLLTRKKDAPFDTEFTTFAEITGGEPSTMRLMPGEYTVRVNSVKYPESPVTIPVDRRCKEFGVWPFDEEVCYDMPEEPLTFDSENALPYGMSEYDAVISADELDKAGRIFFRYVAVGIDEVPEKDRVIEDLNEYGDLAAYSDSIKNKLRPVIT